MRKNGPAAHSTADVLEAEEYMRRTPFTEETHKEMLENFIITRSNRREFLNNGEGSVTTFIRKYRLLTVCNEAVCSYFRYISSIGVFIKNWSRIEGNVLAQARRNCSPGNAKYLEMIHDLECAHREFGNYLLLYL